MAYQGVKVEGAARLRRTLAAAGADMTDLTKLNKAAAGIVAREAKATAPYGPDFGGHIKNTVRGGGGRTAAIVRVGDKRKPYGPALHWGWPSRGIAAQPWVSEAAQNTEPQWVDMYFTGLLSILDSVKGA